MIKTDQNTLKNYLRNIEAISNKDYQSKVWVLAEGIECDDIDEAIDDFIESKYILENYKGYGISEEQLERLKDLYIKLDEFTDSYDVYGYDRTPQITEKFINMPEWEEIRISAAKVLDSFEYKYVQINDFEILVTVTNENLKISEIFYKVAYMAQVYKEKETIVLRFFPHYQYDFWELDFVEALHVLERAKRLTID